MIVAVDLSIAVAVLLVLDHVVLDGAGRAKGLIHAVGKGIRIVGVVSILDGLPGVDPVGTGDAEQATHFTVALQRLIAVADGLAHAAEADVSDWGRVADWSRLVVLDLGLLRLELLQLLRSQLECGGVESERRSRLRLLLAKLLLTGQGLLLLLSLVKS